MALPNVSDYFIPESPQEAVDLLKRFGEGGIIVAGGTFVHGLEVRGVLSEAQALIDIGQTGLGGIQVDESGLTVGATTVFAELEQSDLVQTEPAAGALKDALSCPPQQIRNVGTVGGCLAASAPLYDLPASFLALDGVARVLGSSGAREIPLTEFFTGLFENALATDEIITAIFLPKPAANTTSAFLKLETNANDLAILNVAVRFTRDASGNCADSRIVVGGGVGETYVRAASAEAALNGAPAEADSFASAADAVASDIKAVDDHRGSAAYRTHIAKVFTRRALATALARLS